MFFIPGNKVYIFLEVSRQKITTSTFQVQRQTVFKIFQTLSEERSPPYKYAGTAHYYPHVTLLHTLRSAKQHAGLKLLTAASWRHSGLSLSVSSHLGIQIEAVTKHRPGQMCPHGQMCPQDKQTPPPIRLLDSSESSLGPNKEINTSIQSLLSFGE